MILFFNQDIKLHAQGFELYPDNILDLHPDQILNSQLVCFTFRTLALRLGLR